MGLLYTFLLIEETQTKGNSWSNMLGQFFSLIVVLVIILFLAYYVTKFITPAKYKNTRNSNLKIIESIAVGYQNSLQIIEVGDKTILIGVTKDKINFICDVNENSINKDMNNIKLELPNSFQKYLDKLMNKKNDTKE